MARILAYTSPARGHLYPLTPILDALRNRGHQVAVRTLASEVAMLRDRGLDAAAIDPRIEAIEIADYRASNSRAALAAGVRSLAARAQFDAADLTAAIADEQPDALIVDVNSWGAAAAAQRWGGPWASLLPYPLALPAPGVPPFGPGLTPARGPAGRVRDRLIGPVALGAVERQMLPPVNKVRDELGLPSLAGLGDLFAAPPLLLYLTAEPFEYPRPEWPANLVMVGPCEFEPAAPVPDWLDADDAPLVVVTTSSEFQDDGRLVATALTALADQPVRVVATMPAGDLPAAVPANARVERFLPHGPLLDRAAVVVTHGGMGATQKALARGVPVCAVPFGRDQFEVARRVEVAGAGTRLPASRLSPERLAAAIRQARSRVAGARRVAEGYRAAGGAAAAADAVERRLLAGVRPS